MKRLSNRSVVWFGLGENHILNNVKPNNAGAIYLLKEMFSKKVSASSMVDGKYFICGIQKINGMLKSLIEPFAKIIREHQKCPYHILIEKFCPGKTVWKNILLSFGE